MPDVKNITNPQKPTPRPTGTTPSKPPVSVPATVTPPKPQPPTVPVIVTPPATLTKSNSNTDLAKKCAELNIPGWLQQSQMPGVIGSDLTGFVGFGSSASGKWSEQQAAGIEDGQPYLWHNQNYIPLHPSLNFFLLAGESFQSLMVGKGGEFKWASRDLEIEGPTLGSNRTEAHYVCLLIVDVEGYGLIPIKGDFRGTKSRGIEGSIRAIEAAATPEWLGLSDSHKITAIFPRPFGRVYHKITTEYNVSQSNGNPYFVTNAVCSPANISQMQMLADAFTDTNFIVALEEAKKNYQFRVDFMDKVIANPKVTPTA